MKFDDFPYISEWSAFCPWCWSTAPDSNLKSPQDPLKIGQTKTLSPQIQTECLSHDALWVSISSHSTDLEGKVFFFYFLFFKHFHFFFFSVFHLLACCRWVVFVVKCKEGLGPKQNIPLYAREKVGVGAAGR